MDSGLLQTRQFDETLVIDASYGPVVSRSERCFVPEKLSNVKAILFE
jgi:hypothetical protein